MADVIFNGTDTRKPLGFAEVSLTFYRLRDRTWGGLARRARKRAGFIATAIPNIFLNKTGCRLRDIQNLFADTGVARSLIP